MTADGSGLRSLYLHAAHRLRPHDVLSGLAEQTTPTESPYEAVPRLERRVAELLGKPAAALFPTGSMAQQVAMRIHADQRGPRTVAFHPQCHLELHEHKGYSLVHQLTGRLVGEYERLITLEDLQEIAEPLAALLLELPQRDLGGQLPTWSDLVAQTSWAHERGAATHMDGARLWGAQPYYDRPLAEIAALFDTVYVSLDKLFMGVSGAVLAGSAELIAHAEVWRDRLGGSTQFAWPVALSGERGLDRDLPRMAEFWERAKELVAMLRDVPGVVVVCDPPQTPLFHLHLAASKESVFKAAEQLEAELAVYLPRYAKPGPAPLACGIEITVGSQLDDFTVAEVRELIDALVRRAQQLDGQGHPR